MKKILYLIGLILISFGAAAQHQDHEQYIGSSHDNNVARRGLRSDSTFGLPVIDTTYHPWRIGYETVAHGAIYWWDGFRWRKFTDSASAAGVAGVTTFNTRTGVVVSDSADYANFYAPWNAGVTYNGKHVQLGGSATLVLASADFANQGSTINVLIGNAAGNPAWGLVNINTMTTGTLLVNRGGNGTPTPSLINGLYTTVSGSWPAQAINIDTANFPKNINIGNGYRLVNTGPFGGQSNQIKTITISGGTIDSTTAGVLNITVTPGGVNGFMAARDTINQTAHGFSVGKVVAFNGAQWILADTIMNFPLGVVSIVIDANNFEVTHAGKMRWTAHGKILGVPYFVTSAGNITEVPPNTTIPVIWFITPDIAIVKMERGVENVDGAGGNGATLAGNVGAFSFFNTSMSLGSSLLYNDTIENKLDARNLDISARTLSTDPLNLSDSIRLMISALHSSIKFGDNTNNIYYRKDSLPYFSFDFGYNTYVNSNAHYDIQSGFKDSTWGNKSVNFGELNHVGDPNNYARTNMAAIGALNYLFADSTYAFGSANFLYAQGVGIGFRNVISSSKGIAIGSNNWSYGAGAVTLGTADTASGANSTALGNQTRAGGATSLATGTGSNAHYANQTIIGKWNDSTKANMALEVGWGQNNNTRTNVFSIDTLGGSLFNVGTTANRPAAPAAGYFRYNTDSSGFEFYNTAWHGFAAGGSAVTIYNGDGTLNGNRIIQTGGFTFRFTTATFDGSGEQTPTYMFQTSRSATTGAATSAIVRANQTASNSSTTVGLEVYTKTSHTSGSVVEAHAINARVTNTNVGNVTTMHGIDVDISTTSSGNINSAMGVFVSGVGFGGTGSGTITNAYGIYVLPNDATGGTITNSYGVYVVSQAGAIGINVTGGDKGIVANGGVIAGQFTSSGGNAISATGSDNSATAVIVTASGTGNMGLSSSSVGNFALQGTTNRASTSTVSTILNLTRNTSGTAAAGIGAAIEFAVESDGGSAPTSNLISSYWSVATNGTETSKLLFLGKTAGSTDSLLSLAGAGNRFPKYGAGTITGTPTFYIATDASGNLIETTIPGAAPVLDVEQVHTAGSTVTVTNGVDVLYVDPASLLASLTITLPATPHNSNLLTIAFGGTIASGAAVVTTLSIVGNSGQTIEQIAPATTANGGNNVILRWRASTSKWYRIN